MWVVAEANQKALANQKVICGRFFDFATMSAKTP
jgi:hypothetical protein